MDPLLFAFGENLALLVALLCAQAAFAAPMNHHSAPSSQSHQWVGRIIGHTSSGNAVTMKALGGLLPEQVLWHYRMVHHEAQQWNLVPRLQVFPSQYWSTDHLQSDLVVGTILQDLLSRSNSKTLFYAGSHLINSPSLRDFYITPIQILPTDARYQRLQEKGAMRLVEHRFFGADSPSMMLISVPARKRGGGPISIGLHGSAGLVPGDISAIRGHLEQSQYTRSLSDVISGIGAHGLLPIFSDRQLRV